MPATRNIPIEFGGTVYPSIRAFAAAHDLSTSNVRKKRREGMTAAEIVASVRVHRGSPALGGQRRQWRYRGNSPVLQQFRWIKTVKEWSKALGVGRCALPTYRKKYQRRHGCGYHESIDATLEHYALLLGKGLTK